MSERNKIKYVDWVEYYPEGHYLAIGRGSPWDRKIQIRVPRVVAAKLNRIF